MATKIFHIIGIVLVFVLSSCVKDPKDIPGGFNEDSVFRLKAYFGSDSLNVDAGSQAWTMLPMTTSEEGQFTFNSVFSKNGCLENCTPSIKFTFFQSTSSGQNAPENIFNETIKPGLKEFVLPGEVTDSFHLSFSTHPGLFMNGLSYWENTNMPPVSFFPVYQNQVGPNDGVEVCFQSFQYTGCQYSQCMTYIPSTQQPCIAYIEPVLENDRFIRLTARVSGTPPFQYFWEYGDSTQTSFIPVTPLVNEVHASVYIVDGAGNSTHLSQLIKISDMVVDPCYFPIDINTESVPIDFENGFANKAIICVTDSSGENWCSNGVEQTAVSSLAIHSIEEYLNSPNGEESYLVSLSGNIILENELTGETKLFAISDAVISLSHP